MASLQDVESYQYFLPRPVREVGKPLLKHSSSKPLWWPMGTGVMYDIILWGWLKVRYETAAKLEPLCYLFMGNI